MALTLAAPASLGPPVIGLGDGPILIGFADALSAPECAWSLLESGCAVAALAKRGSRPPLRRCREITMVEITDPTENLATARLELRSFLGPGGSAR